ncbi:MAG: 6-pyruvoyl trahydropterin synthase family protein [Myxococcales bacterium]|jgi:6-pyruvoyltetrahydropterin/6-carboxytetrahydropterin synthase
MDLDVEFNFCCAHTLPYYDGPCNRLHGHHYRLLVTISGKPDPKSGMIIDFEELKQIVTEHAVGLVDHRDLNDFMPNPTAENLIVFFWEKLKPVLPGLRQLRLYETPEYSVAYRGE